MKKLIFLLLVFAGFMACENESIQELPQETSVTEDMNARIGDKIDVCHYDEDNKSWHVINISANAWEGHEKHGDVMLVDEDGDGWVSNVNECIPGGDCDDTNAEVNPGVDGGVLIELDDTATVPTELAGFYEKASDCIREEGGAWFGGVDYSVCFRKTDGSDWRIWNTGCGWEIGRVEFDRFRDRWNRYARYYTGQCAAIPPEGLTTEALTTTTFYNGFGGLMSGITSTLSGCDGLQ